jgi:hypothetical protein
VLFLDSNKNFHAHPNNKIGNGGHFLSILDLEFSVQLISEQKFLHPNRPLELSNWPWGWFLGDSKVNLELEFFLEQPHISLIKNLVTIINTYGN